MNHPHRYVCGRCGSVAVIRNTEIDGWRCRGGGHHTPAVYDQLKERWVHEAQPSH